MSTQGPPECAAAIAEFLKAFDAGRFFEAHEFLETYWVGYRGPDRGFYRGLIQAAVALHHVRSGNLVGAAGFAARARRNLAPHAPEYAGVDVADLLGRLAREIGSVGKSSIVRPEQDPPVGRPAGSPWTGTCGTRP